MFAFHRHEATARLQRACAATLVAASALLPSGASSTSWESRMHDQVNQLLRVFNRLGRQKAGDRELRQAERIRRAQVHSHGRQPSELRRLASIRPRLTARINSCET